jgi:hypothetical protein
VSHLRRLAPFLAAGLASFAILAAAGAAATTPPPRAPSGLVEVVVTLPQPPLAAAVRENRLLAARATTRRRLNVRAPASAEASAFACSPRWERYQPPTSMTRPAIPSSTVIQTTVSTTVWPRSPANALALDTCP